jgi:hypothetical protein
MYVIFFLFFPAYFISRSDLTTRTASLYVLFYLLLPSRMMTLTADLFLVRSDGGAECRMLMQKYQSENEQRTAANNAAAAAAAAVVAAAVAQQGGPGAGPVQQA